MATIGNLKFDVDVKPNLTYSNSTTTTGVSSGSFTYNGADISHSVSHYVNTYIDQSFLDQIAEQLPDAQKRVEDREEDVKLKQKQQKNKRLRSLIDNVIFSGPVTVIKWNDGTHTRVRCRDDELYDKEKGLLAAMAKKLYEDTNIFVEELRYWCVEDKEEENEEDDFSEEDSYMYDRNKPHISKDEWHQLKGWFGYDD